MEDPHVVAPVVPECPMHTPLGWHAPKQGPDFPHSRQVYVTSPGLTAGALGPSIVTASII